MAGNTLLHLLTLLLVVRIIQGCSRCECKYDCCNGRKKRHVETNKQVNPNEQVDALDQSNTDNSVELKSISHETYQSDQQLPTYLYYVFGSNEVSNIQHVCDGNEIRTQHISTTTNYSIAIEWADRTKNPIVKIHVPTATASGVKVHDKRNGKSLENMKAKDHADALAHVILEGWVPPQAVQQIYDPCGN